MHKKHLQSLQVLFGGDGGDPFAAEKAAMLAAHHSVRPGVGFVSEGLEEAISEAVNPLLQRAIYSDEPIDLAETAKNAAYSFLVGGALGGVMGGVSGIETAKPQVLANVAASQDSQTLGQELNLDNDNAQDRPQGWIPDTEKLPDDVLSAPSNDEISRYQSQVDGVFDGSIHETEVLQLGKTPEILRQFGAKADRLTMKQSTARKIAYPKGYFGGSHNLGIPALKELQKQLHDPVAIFDSNTQPNSVVVLTAWNDIHGNPVIVAVHFDKMGNVEVENQVASTYGKRDIRPLLGEDNYNVIYTKNNKSVTESLANRLQLPATSSDTLVTYSIARDAEIINNPQKIDVKSPGTLRQGIWGENEIRPQVKTKEDVRPETPDYEAEDIRQNIAELQFEAIEDRLEAEARAEEIERMGREQLEALESRSYEIFTEVPTKKHALTDVFLW